MRYLCRLGANLVGCKVPLFPILNVPNKGAIMELRTFFGLPPFFQNVGVFMFTSRYLKCAGVAYIILIEVEVSLITARISLRRDTGPLML
jgi:hypothetical protein